jgi:hypothetical protein
MRFVQTFLLRLYVDTQTPDRLCGELRPVEKRETYPFKNETSLMELLRQLSKPSDESDQASSVESLPNRE